MIFDLQVNGLTVPSLGLHCDFWQAPADEDIEKLCLHLGSEGVTGFYATLITAPYEEIDRNLVRIAQYVHGSGVVTIGLDQGTCERGTGVDIRVNEDAERASNAEIRQLRAHLAGVHIEGGYISRPGIHPREHLREFDLAKVRLLVEKYNGLLRRSAPRNDTGLIKLWTLCPKVDADGSLTKYLQSQGVRVAYGHSNASAAEANKAFDAYGVDLVTHWPNAMTVVRDPNDAARFDHRKPSQEYLDFMAMPAAEAESWAAERGLELGLGFAAYHRDDVSVTAICGSEEDGDLHMAPEIFKLLYKRKAASLILVSDDVAYSEDELKAGRILGLRGGRVSLAKHYCNAAL